MSIELEKLSIMPKEPPLLMEIVESVIYYDRELCVLLKDKESKKPFVAHFLTTINGREFWLVNQITIKNTNLLLTGELDLLSPFLIPGRIGELDSRDDGTYSFVAWYNKPEMESIEEYLPKDTFYFEKDEFDTIDIISSMFNN